MLSELVPFYFDGFYALNYQLLLDCLAAQTHV